MGSDIVQVVLPSGDPVWVRIQVPGRDSGNQGGASPQDVGLRDGFDAGLDAKEVQGFADTVRGVVVSVRQALDEHRPDALEVEFGVEISVQTGRLLSVLAEGRGAAHVRVTASWNAPGSPQGGTPAVPAADAP